MKHPFILDPGEWLGEGTISFNASDEKIGFYTKWSIPEGSKEFPIIALECSQEVEMQGEEEHISNHFTFSDITEESFLIHLRNDLVGEVIGKGVIDSKKVAWEFREHSNFEGFEVYELQESGEYSFHAEYVSPDQFRSIIDGRLWKKG